MWYNENGNNFFYQWDTSQYLVLKGVAIGTPIHLCRLGQETTFRCETEESDGNSILRIPDSVFRESGTLNIYQCAKTSDGTLRTILRQQFRIIHREKPDDYKWSDQLQEYEEEVGRLNSIMDQIIS